MCAENYTRAGANLTKDVNKSIVISDTCLEGAV